MTPEEFWTTTDRYDYRTVFFWDDRRKEQAVFSGYVTESGSPDHVIIRKQHPGRALYEDQRSVRYENIRSVG